MRIGGEPPGQVQRDGQGGAAQPSEAGSGGPADVQHGHVEAVLERGQVRAVDPVEEPAVAGAAAQVDVLAVVDGQVAALEGEGEAAEAGTALQEGDVESGVGEAEGRGGAGEAAADDDGGRARALVAHACPSRRVVAGRRVPAMKIVAVGDA